MAKMNEEGRPALTKKQQDILDFIKKSILERGYPPSVREIGKEVSLKSTSSVFAHLEQLEKCGYIRRDPSKSRTIEVLDEEFASATRKDLVQIPIVGQVAAGQPLLAVENIEEYFPLPQRYLELGKTTFMLKVKGDSMINVGIYDGDILIVEKKETARNGEIVVCLVDDSATVKRFYKENGHYRLQPENDSMDPIIVDEVSIIGKVTGLFRSFIR